MVQVYSPVGEQQRGFRPLTPRVETLDGKKIGLLWNSKANGDVYLKEFRAFVDETYSGATFEDLVKPGASVLIDAEQLDRARTCDVVVTAFGDCGACSTWSVRDGVALENADIPAVVVITEPFVFKTRLEVETLGVGWLPTVALPHPVGYLEHEVARKVFRVSFGEVVFALTASADALARQYGRLVSAAS